MRSNNYKSVLKHAGLAASVLLLAEGRTARQEQNGGRESRVLQDRLVVVGAH